MLTVSSLQKGNVLLKRGVLDITLNCNRKWSFSSWILESAEYLFLSLFPGPLRPGVVECVSIQSKSQINLFEND